MQDISLIPLEDVPFLIFDLETTGFSPRRGDRICEIALIKTRGGREEASFQTLIDPVRELSPGAYEVNGITPDMLKGKPKFSDIVSRIAPFFHGSCIVGHNVSFDLSFLMAELGDEFSWIVENPILDTLTLSRLYLEEPSNKLENLVRSLNLPVSGHHRAMADVQSTRALLDYIVGAIREKRPVETLQDLLSL